MRNTVIVRGGGDIATGCVQKLWRAGFAVVVLETARPTAIRRGAALSEAVRLGSVTVEDMTGICCRQDEAASVLMTGSVPVVIDPGAELARTLKPLAVVDAVLAKKNLGTHRGMAEITVGLGPGFTAGDDVDIVVETMRGHDLGRLIFDGAAMPDTGVPGDIAGVTVERVVRAPCSGALCTLREIGDVVEAGTPIAEVSNVIIAVPISGVLRGILPDGFEVWAGLKLADIDPRIDERGNCFTVSDKARCIGGAVLEGILYKKRRLDQ